MVNQIQLSHLLFLDDVLLFRDGSYNECVSFKNVLHTFLRATSREISENKSLILRNELTTEVEDQVTQLFNFKIEPLYFGLKYMGYFIKPNNSKVVDWLWLVKKLETIVNV